MTPGHVFSRFQNGQENKPNDVFVEENKETEEDLTSETNTNINVSNHFEATMIQMASNFNTFMQEQKSRVEALEKRTTELEESNKIFKVEREKLINEVKDLNIKKTNLEKKIQELTGFEAENGNLRQQNGDLIQQKEKLEEDIKKLEEHIRKIRESWSQRAVVPGNNKVCILMRGTGEYERSRRFPYFLVRIAENSRASTMNRVNQENPGGLERLHEINTPNALNLWPALKKELGDNIECNYNRFNIVGNITIETVIETINRINNVNRFIL